MPRERMKEVVRTHSILRLDFPKLLRYLVPNYESNKRIGATNNSTSLIEYCLYARKSTEDDERQAMSIDSQIKEMMKNYLKHILTIGTPEERQEILGYIKTKFILQDRHITIFK